MPRFTRSGRIVEFTHIASSFINEYNMDCYAHTHCAYVPIGNRAQ